MVVTILRTVTAEAEQLVAGSYYATMPVNPEFWLDASS